MVPSRRFERPTCPLGGGRSIQLSYEGSAGIFAWIMGAVRSVSAIIACLHGSAIPAGEKLAC